MFYTNSLIFQNVMDYPQCKVHLQSPLPSKTVNCFLLTSFRRRFLLLLSRANEFIELRATLRSTLTLSLAGFSN